MENLETNLKKPHANIVVVGDGGCGKTTLTSTITKVISLHGNAEFIEYKNLKASRLKQVEYETNNRRYTHVDCDDRIDNIKKALSQTNGVILIVDGLMGVTQHTQEKLFEIQEAGINNIAVFINKCDEIDAPELLDLTEMEVYNILKKYGFSKNVTVVRGSAKKALKATSDDASDPAYKSIVELVSAIDGFCLEKHLDNTTNSTNNPRTTDSKGAGNKSKREYISFEKRNSNNIIKKLAECCKKKNRKAFLFSLLVGLIVTVISYFSGMQLWNNFLLGNVAFIIYGICGAVATIVVGFIAPAFIDEQIDIKGCINIDYQEYRRKQSRRGMTLLIIGAMCEIALLISIFATVNSGANLESVEPMIISMSMILPVVASFGMLGFSIWLNSDDSSKEYFVCTKCGIIGAEHTVLKTENQRNGIEKEERLVGYVPSSENTLGYLKDEKGNNYRIYEKKHGHLDYKTVEYAWNSCDQLCKCKKCGNVQKYHKYSRKQI